MTNRLDEVTDRIGKNVNRLGRIAGSVPLAALTRAHISVCSRTKRRLTMTQPFILARDSGRQSKAWGGAQRSPRYDQDLLRKPAIAGGSHWRNLDNEMANNEKLPPAIAGLMCTYAMPLGFRASALHPRLYSAACSAGFGLRPMRRIGP
jgi:hypothetical protein